MAIWTSNRNWFTNKCPIKIAVGNVTITKRQGRRIGPDIVIFVCADMHQAAWRFLLVGAYWTRGNPLHLLVAFLVYGDALLSAIK